MKNLDTSTKAILCMILTCFFGLAFFTPAGCFGAEGAQSTRPVRDDLLSVSFPTGTDGWVSGRWGVVIHTSDGGKTWTPQKTGTDFTLSSIYFIDNKHGWAVGDEGTIISTSNGGKDWQAQKSPVPFFLMDVCFATPLKGWIVTERTHILHTEDGGKTWEIQFKEDDFILKSIAFSDERNGWAVGEYGFIYHTKDGGKTWKQESGFFRFSERTGESEGGNQLFSVTALDEMKAWAAGIEGTLTMTVDGGKNWKTLKTPLTKKPFYGMAGSKNGAIAVAGKTSFFVSEDGGATWKAAQLDPPFPYGWIYGITTRGQSGFAAVGQQGTIYISETGKPYAWRRVN